MSEKRITLSIIEQALATGVITAFCQHFHGVLDIAQGDLKTLAENELKRHLADLRNSLARLSGNPGIMAMDSDKLIRDIVNHPRDDKWDRWHVKNSIFKALSANPTIERWAWLSYVLQFATNFKTNEEVTKDAVDRAEYFMIYLGFPKEDRETVLSSFRNRILEGNEENMACMSNTILDVASRLTQNRDNEFEMTNARKSKGKTSITEYDFFISHANEDKENCVKPLAKALQTAGYNVWYDEFTLKIGDSLRKSIDNGLIKSRYGIVILSNAFFEKNWTQYELDGLVTREMEGHKVILPIWHFVTKSQVQHYSPSLADKFALNTSVSSIDEIVSQLAEILDAS